MSIVRSTSRAIRITVLLWVLTAAIYPGIMLLVGLIFPYQASGSLLRNAQGQVVGSALIGQSFSSDKYFWSRPSTVEYSSLTPDEQKQMARDLKIQPKNPDQQAKLTAAQNNQSNLKTGISGASNLAPSNPDLIKRIKGGIGDLRKAGIELRADLVYTSGSGLDPHINLEAARAQIEHVAKARSLSSKDVEQLIAKNTDDRFLGIFGEPGVNVLKLNLALDHKKPA
ncbi:MAG: K(+)-transporting ATPase subunit C [Chroococcidiopsidaceae cyanobacterium CP_BM_ER_R8_30]|nr:K(+)-transporting ATPase subunit C [Chroococcidiopsidaceae cyanobacterium CP_BM_ER_R8_30]